MKRNFEECLPKSQWMEQMSTGKCKLVEERGENEQLPGLINVGSCGLRVVHGAFRSGAQKTKWGADSILKALYKVFDKSPAKREDYSAITGTILWKQLGGRQESYRKSSANLARCDGLYQGDCKEA